MSSSFENPFLWSLKRLARVANPLKIRVKSSTLAPKIIFHGKLMNAEWKGDPGLRHRSMEFAARIKWCVCTRVTMYTHLCGRDKHASRHGKRMRGARWPRTVHERVTPTERTLADWGAENRCTSARNSLGLLPMPCRWKVLSILPPERSHSNSRFSDQPSARTNWPRIKRWHVLFAFGVDGLEMAVFGILGHSISYEILWRSIEWREWMK